MIELTEVRCLTDHKSFITVVKIRYPLAATGSRGAERTVRIWNVKVRK